MNRPWWRLSVGLAMLGAVALGGIGAGTAGVARTDATRADAASAAPPPSAQGQVTGALAADLGRSVVRWRGTKFRGRGKHEGTVRLATGALALCGPRVCGGRFVLDMRSIAVTDIPPDEPVPRARLTDHLNSPDFFWTGRYPTATFVLRQAAREVGGAHRVAGALTLRGVTRPLTFPATLEEHPGGERRVGARFRIDRQHWGISYRYDPVRNLLVDDDIQLELELVFPSAPAGVRPRVLRAPLRAPASPHAPLPAGAARAPQPTFTPRVITPA